LTFFIDLIWWGLAILVVLVLLGAMLEKVVVLASLRVKKTSPSRHVLTLAVDWIFRSIDFIFLLFPGLLVGLWVLAALPVKLIGLVVLVILGLLAVAAVVGASLPVKTTFTRGYIVKAAPEQVWQALSERPDWRSGFCGYEELAPKGGRSRWLVYHEWFKPGTVEAVEWDPPSKLALKPADRRRYDVSSCTYTIEPVDGGSRLTITDDAELHNPIDRLFERYATARDRRYLQSEARHLRILFQHAIFTCRADLDDATLVRRDDRSL
jgi:hypothetical protein